MPLSLGHSSTTLPSKAASSLSSPLPGHWHSPLWALQSAITSSTDQVTLDFPLHDWLTVGSLNISLGVTVDPLTSVMLVVATGVSLMVQIYSLGYMRGDPGYSRYFAIMCLFTRLHGGPGNIQQHRSNVRVLGVGGSVFLPADRFLVQPALPQPQPQRRPL